MKPYWLWRC